MERQGYTAVIDPRSLELSSPVETDLGWRLVRSGSGRKGENDYRFSLLYVPALTAGQRRCHLLSPAQRPPAEVLERFSFPIHGASFPTSYSTVDFWSGTFSGCKLWSTVLCSSLVSTVDLRYRPAMLVTARRCISSLPK